MYVKIEDISNQPALINPRSTCFTLKNEGHTCAAIFHCSNYWK